MSPHERIVRGVKRKRPDDEEDKETKLRRKLYHEIREVRKTVKKARAFEIRKTLKKLKDTRRKDSESELTKDLEAQVELLKHISYDKLANSAFMTKLRKDKVLHQDPSIQAMLAELASNSAVLAAPGTPMAKVQSRILSSKVLALEIASIVEALRNSLHPVVGSEDEGEAKDDSHVSPPVSKKTKTSASFRKDGLPFKDNAVGSSSERSSERDEGPSEDEDEDEDEGQATDDGWESGTVSAPSTSAASPTRSVRDPSPDDDDSSDKVFDQDSDDEGAIPPKGLTGKKIQHSSSKGQSEFLPSLSVGFTRGDSDSEFSDSEAKFADGVRKNRRGQRARRAIWEKKFGKNANHIKKQQEIVRGPKRPQLGPGSASVDRRSEKGNPSTLSHRQSRPPSRGNARTHKQQNRAHGSSSIKGPPQQTRPKGDNRGKGDELRLHPSWEAKKKQKSASIVPSQGTKIVFS